MSIDDNMGLEKANYSTFQRNYTVRRVGQAPGKFDDWKSLELPNGSVLHTVPDRLVDDHWLPDTALPLIVNERLPIYLKTQLSAAHEHSVPFEVKEQFTYQPGRLVGEITHFFQTHKRFHRILSDRVMSSMAGDRKSVV